VGAAAEESAAPEEEEVGDEGALSGAVATGGIEVEVGEAAEGLLATIAMEAVVEEAAGEGETSAAGTATEAAAAVAAMGAVAAAEAAEGEDPGIGHAHRYRGRAISEAAGKQYLPSYKTIFSFKINAVF